jgi:hypothetical protein
MVSFSSIPAARSPGDLLDEAAPPQHPTGTVGIESLDRVVRDDEAGLRIVSTLCTAPSAAMCLCASGGRHGADVVPTSSPWMRKAISDP